MIEFAALVLVFATGFTLGLYLGERGRRMDIAQLTMMQAGRPEPAEVTQSYDAEAEAINAFNEEDRANFVSEMVAEGYSEEEANEELDLILRRTHMTGSQAI